jgi:hypothetical protein
MAVFGLFASAENRQLDLKIALKDQRNDGI